MKLLVILTLINMAFCANKPYYPPAQPAYQAYPEAPQYGQLGCCRSNYPGNNVHTQWNYSWLTLVFYSWARLLSHQWWLWAKNRSILFWFWILHSNANLRYKWMPRLCKTRLRTIKLFNCISTSAVHFQIRIENILLAIFGIFEHWITAILTHLQFCLWGNFHYCA